VVSYSGLLAYADMLILVGFSKYHSVSEFVVGLSMRYKKQQNHI